MTRADRVRLLFLMAAAGMEDALRKGRPELVEASLLLWEAVEAGTPERFFEDMAVTSSGGRGAPINELAHEARNVALCNLAAILRERHPDKGNLEIAQHMIESFTRYERGQWERDRKNGFSPGGPQEHERRTWFKVLSRGQKMPGTPRYLVSILNTPDPQQTPAHLRFTNSEGRMLTLAFSGVTD